MGLWDRITGQAKAQFLDVIQWLDDSNDTLLWRFPIHDAAITDQSKVIVREGQVAVFVSEGQLSEVLAPGTYTLDTANQPITTFFESIAYALETPYKGDVLFVSTRLFTANGWGTQNPFMMRDAEFGPVRVRAFGTYGFRIVDPAVFVRQVVGTDSHFTTDEIAGQLKKRVVAAFATAVAQAKIPVLDLAAHYMDLGDRLRAQMDPEFREVYGLTLTDLTIGNISLPPEVEKALDARTKMGVLGDLDAYTKLQSAEAIGTAAANPGLGGAGVGMGVGAAMGHTMAQAMSTPAPAATPPPPPVADVWHVSGPDGQTQLGTAALVARLGANRDAAVQVWKPGWPAWRPWTEVPELASALPPAPPPLPSAEYHYTGPSGQDVRALDAVVAAVQAAPDAAHHVWRSGWSGWKSVKEVPEIAARLGPPPAPDTPPPPPSSDDGPPPAPGS